MTAAAGPARTATASPRGDYPELRLFIGGAWVAGERTAAVIDPATEDTIGQVPIATAGDLAAALEAAAVGFAAWRRVAPADRAVVLHRAAELLRQRREKVARVVTLELGKPLREARVEVDTAAGHIEWSAEEGRRGYGRVIPGAAGERQLVLAEPIGPVAAFAPWNAPAITPARKISSALAAGCSVIIKPAEETPGTAICVAQAFADAGLPPGALNVLFGDPAHISGTLIASAVIRGITFTGSVRVGKLLAAQAAGQLKRTVMELGGHAPVIVCADAPVEEVAAGAARAAYRNAGQVCTSPTRFLVARPAYDRFVAALGSQVRALRLGNGFDEQADVGPVASQHRLAAIERLVEDARAKGARVVAGGRRRAGPGYFWEPTVLADVYAGCQVVTEEPFGPLAVVMPFEDVEDALRQANSLPLALAGYVFTQHSPTIRKLSDELDCGAIAVNHWKVSGPETPFGGHKDSGIGLEGGIEGVAAFQQAKFVTERDYG